MLSYLEKKILSLSMAMDVNMLFPLTVKQWSLLNTGNKDFLMGLYIPLSEYKNVDIKVSIGLGKFEDEIFPIHFIKYVYINDNIIIDTQNENFYTIYVDKKLKLNVRKKGNGVENGFSCFTQIKSLF